MRRWQGWRWGVVVALSVVVLLTLAFGVASAAEAPVDTRPERGIAVYTEYSGVVVPVGETVRLDLTVANKGRRDETIALSGRRSGRPESCRPWREEGSSYDCGG